MSLFLPWHPPSQMVANISFLKRTEMISFTYMSNIPTTIKYKYKFISVRLVTVILLCGVRKKLVFQTILQDRSYFTKSQRMQRIHPSCHPSRDIKKMVHPRDTTWSWLYHGTTASASCSFYWAIVTWLCLVTWLEYTRFVNLCKGDEIEEMIACDRDVCKIKCFYMDCLRITKILTASCIECLLLVLKHFWSACACA